MTMGKRKPNKNPNPLFGRSWFILVKWRMKGQETMSLFGKSKCQNITVKTIPTVVFLLKFPWCVIYFLPGENVTVAVTSTEHKYIIVVYCNLIFCLEN